MPIGKETSAVLDDDITGLIFDVIISYSVADNLYFHICTVHSISSVSSKKRPNFFKTEQLRDKWYLTLYYPILSDFFIQYQTSLLKTLSYLTLAFLQQHILIFNGKFSV